MRRYLFAAAALSLAYGLALVAASAPRPGKDWPQFRGISAHGIAEGFSLPLDWDMASGKNVALDDGDPRSRTLEPGGLG